MTKSIFEQNGITYRKVGYFKIPNLILPPEEASITLGKWGMLNKDYLLNHKKVIFATLLAEGKLWQYLADIDNQAQQMFDILVEQMKEAEGLTEQLKEQNQLKWVCRMVNIEARVREVVTTELIYIQQRRLIYIQQRFQNIDFLGAEEYNYRKLLKGRWAK